MLPLGKSDDISIASEKDPSKTIYQPTIQNVWVQTFLSDEKIQRIYQSQMKKIASDDYLQKCPDDRRKMVILFIKELVCEIWRQCFRDEDSEETISESEDSGETISETEDPVKTFYEPFIQNGWVQMFLKDSKIKMIYQSQRSLMSSKDSLRTSHEGRRRLIISNIKDLVSEIWKQNYEEEDFVDTIYNPFVREFRFQILNNKKVKEMHDSQVIYFASVEFSKLEFEGKREKIILSIKELALKIWNQSCEDETEDKKWQRTSIRVIHYVLEYFDSFELTIHKKRGNTLLHQLIDHFLGVNVHFFKEYGPIKDLWENILGKVANIDKPNNENLSPLEYVVSLEGKHHEEEENRIKKCKLVRKLKEYGAITYRFSNPHRSSGKPQIGALQRAVIHGHWELVEILKRTDKEGSNEEGSKPKKDLTFNRNLEDIKSQLNLCDLIYRGDIKSIKNNRVNPNFTSPEGFTPLQIAAVIDCIRGNDAIVKLLLKKGSNPHVGDPTPVHLAIFYPDVFFTLANCGGTRVMTSYGNTAEELHRSREDARIQSPRSLFSTGKKDDFLYKGPSEPNKVMEAINDNDPGLLLALLRRGENITGLYEGKTFLHIAIEEERLLISLLLLAAGADPNALDDTELTPMKLAERKGIMELIPWFKKALENSKKQNDQVASSDGICERVWRALSPNRSRGSSPSPSPLRSPVTPTHKSKNKQFNRKGLPHRVRSGSARVRSPRSQSNPKNLDIYKTGKPTSTSERRRRWLKSSPRSNSMDRLREIGGE